MSKSTRVSVVIPAYNSEKYIGQTIESVLRQSFPDWEMVILDDGSRDRTVEIARSYAARDPRIRVHPRENGGVAAARNSGFAETDPASEFVSFLDNDDTWEPDALEVLVRALDDNARCSAAHGLAQSMDERGNRPDADTLEDFLRARRGIIGARCQDWPLDAPTTFAVLAFHNYTLSPGTSLIRRSAFEKVQGFDPRTVPCDDWDLALRISREGDYAFVNRVVLHWRRHAQAASNVSSRWRRAFLYSRLKMIRSSANTPSQRQIAKTAYLLSCAEIRAGAFKALTHGKLAPAAKEFTRWLYFYGAYVGASIVGYPNNADAAIEPQRGAAIAR